MAQRFQFSLRSLFWLTAVVSVVVGTMSMLGQTQHFRALGSYHAYLALLPIAGVWVAWRIHPLFGQNFFRASVFLYLLSLVLPCIAISPLGPLLGFQAVILTSAGMFGGITEFELGACLLFGIGFLSNGGYLLTLYRGAERQRRRKLRKTAWIPLVCSVLAFALWGNAIDTIYIGYGAWVAAMWAMWLGVREEVSTDRVQS